MRSVSSGDGTRLPGEVGQSRITAPTGSLSPASFICFVSSGSTRSVMVSPPPPGSDAPGRDPARSGVGAGQRGGGVREAAAGALGGHPLGELARLEDRRLHVVGG